MTGTPDRRRTVSRKIKEHDDSIRRQRYNTGRAAYRGSSVQGRNLGSGRQSIPVSNDSFIKKDGDTVMGALGWFADTIIIDDNQIDIAPDDNVSLQRPLPTVFLQAESGTADNLVTITNAKFMQQELWVRAVSNAQTITIKDKASSQTAWALSTGYILGDIISNGGNIYSCKQAHTSSSSDEPGVGANWTDYWYKGNIRTPDGNDFDIVGKKYYRLVYDIADGAWVITTSLGSGSGGLSEPVRFSVSDHGDVGGTSESLDFDNYNVFRLRLTGDISIQLNGTLPSTKFQMLHIVILQDGTGGHSITSWDSSINGTPSIDSAANSLTTVSLFSLDQGVTWYFVSTEGGIAGDASQWATYSAVQNVDVNDKDILKVKNLDFDDPLSKILGLQKIEYYNANQTSESLSTGLEHKVADQQSHKFFAGTDPIGEFIENLSNELFLDMHDNEIRNLERIRMPQNAVGTVTNIPEIHFDDVTDLSMVFNVPTNRGYKFKENGTDLLTIDETGVGGRIRDLDVLELGNQLKLLDAAADPVANGEFKRNGADVKVFTGGGVKNLSDIGGSDNLGNHTAEQDLDMAGFNIDSFDSLIANTLNPAAIGRLRMANQDKVSWRNAADSADVFATVNASNHLETNASVIVGTSSTVLGQETNRFGTLWAEAVDLSNSLTIAGDSIMLGDVDIGDSESDKLNIQSLIDSALKIATTVGGQKVAEILGVDDTTDRLEIDLESNTDFELKAQANSILFYDQSMNEITYGQKSIFDKDLLLKEVSINPASPPSNYVNIFAFSSGSTKEIRAKNSAGDVITLGAFP